MTLHFDLKTFTFNGHTLRTTQIDGKPWFVGRDVLSLVGISADGISHYASRHLNGDEVFRMSRNDYNHATQTICPGTPVTAGIAIVLVSESGLYKIILRAQRKNPAARVVQDWVTKDVLPAIRRDDGYVMGEEKVATGAAL